MTKTQVYQKLQDRQGAIGSMMDRVIGLFNFPAFHEYGQQVNLNDQAFSAYMQGLDALSAVALCANALKGVDFAPITEFGGGLERLLSNFIYHKLTGQSDYENAVNYFTTHAQEADQKMNQAGACVNVYFNHSVLGLSYEEWFTCTAPQAMLDTDSKRQVQKRAQDKVAVLFNAFIRHYTPPLEDLAKLWAFAYNKGVSGCDLSALPIRVDMLKNAASAQAMRAQLQAMQKDPSCVFEIKNLPQILSDNAFIKHAFEAAPALAGDYPLPTDYDPLFNDSRYPIQKPPAQEAATAICAFKAWLAATDITQTSLRS
ncbi:hypothetical protein NHP190003_13430 [Helicobacter sp. NHP19-003]|uniref:Uncharacterized protein n=1 Tax=Helicobacter gastrocanis TaxID=2849641 RepID=A0ABM7SDI9_9HELI|nr:hypothetical protein [Helicobacter sp. NHP19-003]BCZ18061.1 hypothetical protein NHP190003_13430 [Helicobacter sp. NHP19-003]